MKITFEKMQEGRDVVLSANVRSAPIPRKGDIIRFSDGIWEVQYVEFDYSGCAGIAYKGDIRVVIDRQHK